ncbi:hypothetical protein NHX12_014238 [Muraenolepis orangiensis]|uniref:Immunoglobulin domain-containing protein n=1 Tax=Muraenolepis orangiensis TaxID=630683 RepID=A0A9Q0I4E3_9TELE|nr:hypothetical protein NHX12_014238 [Muraenolepis orangiensis]
MEFFIFLLIHFSTGEAHSVMALVGDDVTLSYDTKQLKDISEETVEWSRADLKPDLVHLLEDRRSFYKLQNPAYRGRTVLSEEDLERGIISLRLSRVRLADEGNYTCLFTSVHNQYTVQLLVGAASSPVIRMPTAVAWFWAAGLLTGTHDHSSPGGTMRAMKESPFLL